MLSESLVLTVMSSYTGSISGKRAYSLAEAHGLLTAVTCLIVEHMGSRAQAQ